MRQGGLSRSPSRCALWSCSYHAQLVVQTRNKFAISSAVCEKSTICIPWYYWLLFMMSFNGGNTTFTPSPSIEHIFNFLFLNLVFHISICSSTPWRAESNSSVCRLFVFRAQVVWTYSFGEEPGSNYRRHTWIFSCWVCCSLPCARCIPPKNLWGSGKWTWSWNGSCLVV